MDNERSPFNYHIDIPRQDLDVVRAWMKENFPDEMFDIISRTHYNDISDNTNVWLSWKWHVGFETKEAMLACKLMFG